MMITFNMIVMALFLLYAIWLGYSEHRKEQASAAALTEAQAQRFQQEYSFGRPAEEYPQDIRDHAVIAQRARIRKGAAVVILVAIPLLTLFRGF